ncbi:MAG: protein translocase subunit SecD [Planctomycetaceae bacterium]|nr:protein translocase subunit SecD [Planctomycetaceae bacterium]
MTDFIRKWHPLLLLIIAIYLAIPKPSPEPGDRFQWPLNAYKWNLGQDLSGGSSLRYKLVQQDLTDAEQALRELLEPLKGKTSQLNPEAARKFGDLINGGPLKQEAFTVREKSDESDDFDLLKTAGLFDEGRVEAARKRYSSWRAAAKRKTDKALSGPTIETLYRRLGTSGITELSITPLGEDRLEVKLPKFASAGETQRYKDLLETTGKLEIRVLAPDKPEFTRLSPPQLPKDEGYKYKWLEVLDPANAKVSNTKELGGKTYVLVQVIDPWDLSGKDIENIEASVSDQGKLAVSFAFKGLAVAKFEDLTKKHNKNTRDPRLVANLIDEKVYGAYSIEGVISGSVQVSGSFTRDERDALINVLKSGSLNVKLELEGEESVGPSEGAEAIQQGVWSFAVAALFVFFFALWLYRALGVLVIFNLLMIVILIMGAMAAGLGTLTLPGIAGLVLTFGMAIDGNILINERMREELKKGMSARAAAEEGFKNAFSAIIDSNITTLLTALILFKVGSGPVQGFALTVAIGIVATLYANIPAYKAMVLGVIGIKRDIRFGMADLSFLENRNIDFVKYMKMAIPVTAVIGIAGTLLLISLGSSVLGMEFRGGHAFRVQFKEESEADTVRAKLLEAKSDKGTPKYAEADVQPIFGFGELAGTKATRFDLRFPMRDEWESQDPKAVNDQLKKDILDIFGAQLQSSGWVSRPSDAREISLTGEVQWKWKDAETAERNKDIKDKPWKIAERSWNGKEDAPITKKQEWFGEVLGGADAQVVPGTVTTSADGMTQTYSITILKLPVTDSADMGRKRDAFQRAMRKVFKEDADRVLLATDDVALPSVTVTRGSLEVDVTLNTAVSADLLTQAATAIQAKITALGTLTVTPRNVKDGKTAEFNLRSAEVTYSPDITSSTSFAALDNDLREELAAWLQNTPEVKGVYISQPFLMSTTIGAAVAGETQWRALLAIIAALIVLVVYIRVRFAGMAWGLAAIVALGFDVLVTLAAIGVADMLGADMKVDLIIVAALLTVIGYAINDTIVNFDRIRELLRADRLATGGKTPLRDIINQSANQMLTRTVMTGGTTLTSTLIMMFLGGPLLRGFAFAIFVGVIMGTFASVFIASPILLIFEKRGREGLYDLTAEENEEADKIAEKEESAPEPDAKDFEDDDKAESEKKDEAKASEEKKGDSSGAAPAQA